jgi:GMP synthase (glutamine-hydrolysing)
MRVYVIDNGGQWTHREWRVLRDLEVDAVIVPNDTPVEKLADADAIVLSGGAPSIAYEKQKLGNQGLYLKELTVPILGICVGAQFIAEFFGGKSSTAKYPEYGKTEVFIDNPDDIFLGLPEKIIAWESHNDEIKELGNELIPLAHSENCKYQAIKHKQKPIYGVQFHPEVQHTQYGEEIFKNFLNLARK